MCSFLLIKHVAVIVIFQGFCINGEKTQCEIEAAKVALENQNTIVDTSSARLIGTWLSEGCEIRPGPEYLLRLYTFHSDGSYNLLQHHYWDDSCSSPKLTIISNGLIYLKKNLLLNPDAATGYIDPRNITIIPYDSRAANDLHELVRTECPDQTWKPFKLHEEHLVFESNGYSNINPLKYNSRHLAQFFAINSNSITQNQQPSNLDDIHCMGSLKWAFNELKLIKIQVRPLLEHSLNDEITARLELLLGDIHSRLEKRQHYIPTSYQIPLLKYMKSEEYLWLNGRNYTIRNLCNICTNLYVKGKRPPHLTEKPHLPPYIWGEWISMRCEIRPMGLYLTRKFSFYSDYSIWIGEHKFYQDPFCTIPKFVVTAAGHFSLTSTSSVIAGGTNIDFKIEKASLTIYGRRMLHEMRMFGSCGKRHWEIGVPQELSSTKGCLQLGIIIPSVQYEVIKVEMNYEGSCLLYLGQADTDNMPNQSIDRPTSFQVPLVKCGDVLDFLDNLQDSVNDNNNFYDDALYNRAKTLYSSNLKFVIIILISILFL